MSEIEDVEPCTQYSLSVGSSGTPIGYPLYWKRSTDLDREIDYFIRFRNKFPTFGAGKFEVRGIFSLYFPCGDASIVEMLTRAEHGKSWEPPESVPAGLLYCDRTRLYRAVGSRITPAKRQEVRDKIEERFPPETFGSGVPITGLLKILFAEHWADLE